MEILHLSAWIREWLATLPLNVQYWIKLIFYTAVILVALVVLYSVSRQESISESGKVVVKWYHPKYWMARYQHIKAENHQKLPANTREFVEKCQRFLASSHRWLDIGYGLIFALLGFLGLAISILLNPIKAWWMLIPSLLLLYFGYKTLKK